VVPDFRLEDSPAELRSAVDGTIRFFAGASLRDSQGIEIGAFCIGDRRAGTLDDAQLAVFTDLAEWVRREMISSSDSIRARALQKRLLPREAPRIPGYQVAATCTRAGSVGGDFYDWQTAGADKSVFVLADVVGKGTAAAIMSGTVRGVLRTALADAAIAGNDHGPQLARSVARTAELMYPDLQGTGKFATAFVCALSPAENRLTWVDAGHGLAVITHADGSHTWLGRGDLPIGVTADATWKEHTTTFRPGDTLLMFSDGLLELGGVGLDSLGDVQRLVSRLVTADKVIDTIGELAGAGAVPDDITAVAIHRPAGDR
jgi:serine phosphatase RsbU (regulator of sigma subunit)